MPFERKSKYDKDGSRRKQVIIFSESLSIDESKMKGIASFCLKLSSCMATTVERNAGNVSLKIG